LIKFCGKKTIKKNKNLRVFERWELKKMKTFYYEKMNECDLVGIKALRASSIAIWLWLWHMAMVFHKYTTHLAVIYDDE